jgi:hypothetical protein
MEGKQLVRRKSKQQPQIEHVEFAMHKNNTIYLKNASYMLGRAAALAEASGDTDTLLQIAGAWLEIDRDLSKRKPKSNKKKLPMGFTAIGDNDTISDEEDADE